MKPSFLLSAANVLVSSLVPANAASVLIVGTRVTALRPLDLEPYTTINTGECGTIDEVDHVKGRLEIKWDTPHWGLHRWNNHITMVPFATADIEDGIACCLPERGLVVRARNALVLAGWAVCVWPVRSLDFVLNLIMTCFA